MNKIRVIDLLNKISNGEEVPKKIRITDVDDRITRHYIFFYDEDEQEYKDDELFPLGARLILDRVLNKKVEVLDLLEELKEELGNNYDLKLYEMGISALKEIENLQQENKQLKDNWNELKKWLEENESFDDYCNETTFTSVLDKMQELEGSDSNEKISKTTR